MLRIAASWLLATVAWCQTASVTGVVLNQATGGGVRKVVVTLWTLDELQNAVEVTDSQGRFTFAGLPGGTYRISIAHPGTRRRLVTVRPGEAVADVTLKLVPYSSVSGRVLDDFGEPVPGMDLQMVKRTWDRGRQVFARANGGRTNDRGEYRVTNIPPGTYFLVAKSYVTVRPTQPGMPDQVHALQFWRGADTLEGATPLVITGGKDLEGIDFQLRFARTSRIGGKLVGLPEDRRGNFGLQLVSRDLPAIAHHSYGHTQGNDGQFEFFNVLPGAYNVFATFEDLRAVVPVRILGGERLSIDLPLQPLMPVAGTVQGDVPVKNLRVRLVSAQGLPDFMYPHQVTAIKPDGSFNLPKVPPGTWDIAIDGLPPGAYVKSMMLGEQDVLIHDMVVSPRTSAPLRIIVSSKAARIEGTLDKSATLLLAPEGKLQSNLGFYDMAATTESGAFTFANVRPGAYKLYAFEDMDGSEWQEPGFLKPFEALGTAVTIKESETLKLTPQLIPRSAP